MGEIDGYVTEKAVEEARRILADPERQRQMVDHNYTVASRFYSYAVLEHKLVGMLYDVMGCRKVLAASPVACPSSS